MKIGGFQRFSMVDYPEKTAAVIFTQGCNFRCPYCHNPELVDPTLFNEPIAPADILSFLSERKGKLDGVVITGGEPTLQTGLLQFIEEIKGLGFPVKLDTNGTRPKVVAEILNRGLVDFIVMDIKAPLNQYPLLAGAKVEGGKITDTISLIKTSGIPYQFRTTVIPRLHNEESIRCIREWVAKEEISHTFQDFVQTKILSPDFLESPAT